MMICASAQAETYIWTGATNNNWAEAGNWTDGTGATVTSYPNNNDDFVYIRSAATISIGSSDVHVDGISLFDNGESNSFSVTISGTGTLRVRGSTSFPDNIADVGIVTYRPTAAENNESGWDKTTTLVLDCNVEANNLAIHSGGSVTISSGKTARITNVVNMAGSGNVSTAITVNGTLISETISLSDQNNQTLTIDSGATVSATTITGSNGSVTNNGQIAVSNTTGSNLDTINTNGSGTIALAGENTCTWKGNAAAPASNTDWNTAANWQGGIPGSTTDKIIIPGTANLPEIKSGDSVTVDLSKLEVASGASIKASGTLIIDSAYTIDSIINADSSGKLQVNGTLTNSSANSFSNLTFECTSLDISANLQCKSMKVSGTTSLTNASDETHLFATGADGISFGGDVTVNSSGTQFVLGGNVSANSAVNLNIAHGTLSHIEEPTTNRSNWSSSLTAVLQNAGCTFGMQDGQSYKTKITASSGDVYFTGNGTISTLDDTGADCDIHFGNGDDSQNNTITLGADITFHTSGDIVLDKSCSGLTGSKTLSGITNLSNLSSKLTDQLSVNFELNDGAEISGNSLKFADVTCTGTATINNGNNSFVNFTAGTSSSGLGGKTLTINGAQTISGTVSLHGTSSSNQLNVAGSGTFNTSALSGRYLAIGPDVVLSTPTTLSDCTPSVVSPGDDDWLTVMLNGWLIRALKEFTFTWTGANGSAWNNEGNWDTGFVPVTDCKIVIENTANKPVISAASEGGTLTIESDASVQLGANALTLSGTENVTSATILTNNGTIIYTDAGRITDSSSNPINDTAHGTVEYAAGGNPGTVNNFIDNADTDDYCNLVISGTGWRLANTLKMQTITVENGATCTVNSATTLRAQTFNFNGDSTHKNINASANLTLLPYVATDDLTVPSGIDSKFTISSDGTLHLGNASTNSIIFAGSDPFDFNYELNFLSPVTLNRNVTVEKTVTANAAISGSEELIFAGTDDIEFNAGTYTHSNITVDKDNDSGSLTINDNCLLPNLKILNGKTITFAGTPEITTYTDTAASGNLIFSSGATFTNSFIRNSGGTTQITGTITASSVTLKNTTISGAATITTTGTQNFTGTINGATGSTDELTLEASSVTFNDNVGATSLKKLTVNAPLTIGVTEKSIAAGEIDFQGAILGDEKKLTVNTPIFKSTATTDNTITLSELTFAANSTSIDTSSKKLTFTVSAINGAEKTIALSSGSEAELAAGITVLPAVTNGGTITCSGAVTFGGNISNTNGTLTCNDAATFKGAYSGTSATLTLSSGITTFESNLDLSGTTFAHSNGTVQIGGTSAAVVTVTGPQTFYNFEISRSLKILGANNFLHDFTATNMGGKSISFEAGKTQTVSGAFSLSGVSGSLLTLKNEGTGVWTITCSNPTISYVDVINSTSTNSIFALNSNDSGNNTNWNFPGRSYTWTGATTISGKEHDWNTASNWSPASIPGIGTKVTIAAATNHPILTEALNLNQTYNGTAYNGEITVAANAKFDLADKTLTVGSITNNGTVCLKGVASQISGTVSNGDTDVVSTVEYYDVSTELNSLAWGTSYEKLIINKPTNLNSTAISVSDTTTVTPGSGKDVSLNNPSNSFGGVITVNAGAFTLNSSSDLTIAANALADSLSITCADGKAININTITTSGAQTFDGAVTVVSDTTLTAVSTNLVYFKKIVTGIHSLSISTANSQFDGVVSNLTSLATAATASFNANITGLGSLSTNAANINCESVSTTGAQTYTGAVTVQRDAVFTANAGQLIKFQNTLTGSGSPLPAVTIQTANSQFDGAISYLTSLTTGAITTLNADISNVGTLSTAAASINCSSISTSGNQTYGGAVTLGASPSLTSGGDILFDSTVNGTYTLTLNQASSTTFNGIVQLTGFADSASHNGSVTFKENTTISDAVNLHTPQTVTFGDTDTDIFTFNSNLSHTAGATSITGTLTAANISLGNLTAQGNITTSGSQTYNGTVALTDDLTLSSTAASAGGITFASTISGTYNLEISTNTGTNGTTFNNNVGGPDPLSSLSKLTVSGPLAISTNCEVIRTTNEQTYNGAIILEHDTSLISTSKNISFASTIDSKSGEYHSLTLNTQDGTTFSDNVGNTRELKTLEVTGALAVTSGCAVIKTNQGQTYNGAVTVSATSAPALTAVSNKITFNNTVNLSQNLSLTASGTSGGVLFDTTSAVDGNKKLTITAGSNPIDFKGSVGSQTAIGELEIVSSGSTGTTFTNAVAITKFTDTAASGNITFNNGGTISTATEFNTTGTLTFGDAAGDTMNFGASSYANLTHTTATGGDTVITGTLNAAVAKLNNTKLTGTLNAKTMLYGNLTSDGTANFAQDLFILGNTATLNATTSITASKDIIVAKTSAQNLTVSQAVSTQGNFVLYSGNLLLNANLTTQKDLVLVGSAYNAKDSSTGYENAYAYNTPRPTNWSKAQYVNEGTTPPSPQSLASITLPDATSVSTKAGSLTAAAGVVIHTGKNFYANGITMYGSGSGTWYIDILNNSDSSVCFAEAYNCTVTNCTVRKHSGSGTTGTEDSDNAQIAAENCGLSGCPNWDSTDFEITDAWTVRDNSVYIKFNRAARNANNELNTFVSNLAYFYAADNDTAYSAFKNNADATENITESDEVYIIGASGKTWNTDATGSDIGRAGSTDRYGNHREAKPYLDIPRSLGGSSATTTQSFVITDRFGKRLLNYSIRTKTSGTTFTNVLDHTGPVLWTVRTGQELHAAYDTATGEASQHSYDSHNFLEFRYSEPVNIGSGTETIAAYNPPADPSHTPNVVENIQVTDTLGAVTGSITSAASEITFAGLARITGTSLLLHTGSNGSANKYMNALYRQDEYSIRLSIAGWTDGTVSDYAGNSYKKWPGYIEAASQFTGATAHIVDSSNAVFTLVKDQANNTQTQYAANMVNPQVLGNSSDPNPDSSRIIPNNPDLYSQWDLSSPVFAPLRFSSRTEWEDQEMSEAIGNTNGSGSTLDRIDFHFFDNTPTYSSADPAEWFTEIGWCNPDSDADKANLKDASYTYAADIIGGARQFDDNADRRTTGGIRFSTKADISPAFKYATSYNSTPSSNFLTGIANIHTTVVSQLFTGSSAPMRAANDPDGLYMGLSLTDTNLSFDTTFTFAYSDAAGYLTDLAGNRLRSKTSKTIDRTPPSFDVIISPVDTKAVYIIFVKEIVTDHRKISYRDNSAENITINESFENLMPICFRLISIDASGNATLSTENQIDTSVPAQIVEDFSNESFTCIKLTTVNDINIDNLKNLYVQLIIPEPYMSRYPTGTLDPLTNNINSQVTFIQDQLGNYMSLYSAHSLSDFAVNYVNPLYAYSSDMNDEKGPVMNNLYEEGSWAVHDWNAGQQNYGTLPANHSAAIVADTKGDEKIRIYLSNSPDAASVSHQFNTDFALKLRIWLPDLQDGIFRALSAENNTNYVFTDGSLTEASSQNSIFNLSKEMISAWPSGSQVSFVFGLMEDEENPVRIYNTPYYDVATGRFNLSLSIPVPLYCLRMTNTEDIKTLDLWSFKLRGITEQRGGVTILNNVINADKGEHTVVKVNMPEDGRLNVIVMTLDGNIISYLNRGNVKAGEHYFTWNGKNKAGKTVARGMYFVRVTGTGIDETRKVMVVK